MEQNAAGAAEPASWGRFSGYVVAGFALAAASILTLGMTAPAASILVAESSRRGVRPHGKLSAGMVLLAGAACLYGLFVWVAMATENARGDSLGGIKASPLAASAVVLGGIVLAAATWGILRLIGRTDVGGEVPVHTAAR